MDEFELSVVIPVYNEEENVRILYEELKEVLSKVGKSYEIIFVDDGSTDRTFQILKELNEKDKTVKVIRFRRNFGQSAALKAGFDYAKGKIVVSMDGDLQNDPRDIPKLLEKMENEDLDVVCGWRYNRKDPVSKKLFSKIANWLRRRLTKEKIHDSGCTLRAYKSECVKDLELYGEMHRYIPALLLWKGYRIGEVKVNHRPRVYGKTKYNWKRLIKGFLDLIVVTFWQKYSFRPIHVFGGFGLIFSFVGIFLFLYLIFLRFLYNVGLSDRPLFIVSILLIIVGFQFIATGILADIMLKIYNSDRKPYLIERILD
jgi:glycosyltransferase involved in cell wall biosynthesis